MGSFLGVVGGVAEAVDVGRGGDSSHAIRFAGTGQVESSRSSYAFSLRLRGEGWGGTASALRFSDASQDGCGSSNGFRAEARVTFFARAKKGNQRKHALTAARATRGFASGSGIFGRHIHVPSENGAHRARRPCGVVPDPLAGLYGIRKAESNNHHMNRLEPAQRLAVAVASAFGFQGSLEAWRQGRGKTRRAAHMDVRRFRKGQDAPSGNPRPCREPGARSAEGTPPGWPFFWFLFFGHAKKRNSPVRAKAFAYEQIKPNRVSSTQKGGNPSVRAACNGETGQAFAYEHNTKTSRVSSGLRHFPAAFKTSVCHAEPAA